MLAFRLDNPWWEPHLRGKEFDISTLDEKILVDLSHNWRFSGKVEKQVPRIYTMQTIPSALYHGMIDPLFRTAVKGVIWYQGENNGDQGADYRRLFPAMISDWRIRFKQGYFPFLFIQLANLGTPTLDVENSGWPFLREAQDYALHLPYTGMATAIDVGDEIDIHPRDKKTVADRLAIQAMKVAYGIDTLASGPRYEQHLISEDTIFVDFKHAKGLYTRDDQPPQGFSLAGEDRVFYPASARIMKDGRVAVWSPDVSKPVSLRYAWARNPIINLYNAAGLPALPFRTDDWKSRE